MSSVISSPPTPARRAPLLIPLACYFVWGSTYLAIRFALISFPPFFQMGTLSGGGHPPDGLGAL